MIATLLTHADGDASIQQYYEADSFQLTHNVLRDDDDNIIATFLVDFGWSAPDATRYTDIIFAP